MARSLCDSTNFLSLLAVIGHLHPLLFIAKFCFIAETEEILCNFEEGCAFEEVWKAKERWTYSPPRKTKWDNTLNIRKFIQVAT